MNQHEVAIDGVSAPPTNGLGLAGFICSLAGLFTGGLLCPVGLIMSLVALGRQPKGYAIAGVILGLIGTCGGLLLAILFGGAMLAALGLAGAAAVIAMSEPEKAEITGDSIALTTAIESVRAASGQLPASLDELNLDGRLLIDPWGNPYRLEILDVGGGYRIMTDGPDGVAGTPDDQNIRDMPELWRAPSESDPPPDTPQDS